MSIFLGTGNFLTSTAERELFNANNVDLTFSNFEIQGYSGAVNFEISGKDYTNNPKIFTGLSFKNGKIFSEQSKFVGSYESGEVFNINLKMKKQETSTGSFYEIKLSGSQDDSDLKFNGYSSLQDFEKLLFKSSGSGFLIKFDPVFKLPIVFIATVPPFCISITSAIEASVPLLLEIIYFALLYCAVLNESTITFEVPTAIFAVSTIS